MYIIGASGHAKALLDLIEDYSSLKGIYDDNLSIEELLGLRVQCPIPENLPIDSPYIIGIGDNQIRKKIASTKLKGYDFFNVQHHSALISKNVVLGSGIVFMEMSIIKVGSVIGDHVIINTRSTVDHDCEIGDYVHLAPGSTTCGGVSIGEGTLIGAGAIILPNISIGCWCKIAAGSVVHKSIPDGVTWIGDSLKKI